MESLGRWPISRLQMLAATITAAACVVFIDRWVASPPELLFIAAYGGLLTAAFALVAGIMSDAKKLAQKEQELAAELKAASDSAHDRDLDRSTRAARRENLLQLADAFEKSLESVLDFVSGTSVDTQKSASA